MDDMEVIVFEDLPSKKTPLDADNLNKIQQNAKKAIKNRKPTIELLTVSSTAPSKCTIRDKYYNTTTSKIYTAIATNTWGTEGENPSDLYLYADLEHKELYYYDGTTFVSYGGGSGGTGGDTLPIGSIVAFASDTIPNGWLLCDGSVVSRTTYSELFNAIGLNYVEEGYEWQDEERFPLPNAKGRTLVGKDSTDTDFNTLGKTSGEKTHTLTVDEMPSHKHELIVNRQLGGVSAALQPTWGTAYSSTDSGSISNTGGDQPHNNLQPCLVTNFIIKAKNIVVVKGDVIQENGTASETNVYSATAVNNKIENSAKTNIVTGQEVATNEYVDGKQVFVKRIDFGNLPNKSTKNVSTGLENSKIVVVKPLQGFAKYQTGSVLTLPACYPLDLAASIWVSYEASKNAISITTGNDRSVSTGYIDLYYTKNT